VENSNFLKRIKNIHISPFGYNSLLVARKDAAEKQRPVMKSPASVLFPRSLQTWHIFPHSERQSVAAQSVNDIFNTTTQFSMDNTTDVQNSEPQPPASTGVEHWEQQRRKWTKGFTETSSRGGGDVSVKR
jgi:hypothetical protein